MLDHAGLFGECLVAAVAVLTIFAPAMVFVTDMTIEIVVGIFAGVIVIALMNITDVLVQS